MREPYFPIGLDAMSAALFFHHLKGSSMRLGEAEISWRKMKHPGSSYSYKIKEGGRALVFSTDTELIEADFLEQPETSRFYRDVEVLIMDSQYTLDEAIEKYDWGHSSYSLAVDFAVAWDIENLYLFHHEPHYEDKKIFTIEQSARWYLNHQKNHHLNIICAREGLEIEL